MDASKLVQHRFPCHLDGDSTNTVRLSRRAGARAWRDGALRSEYAMGCLPRLEAIDHAGGSESFRAFTRRQFDDRHSGRIRQIFRPGIVAHIKLTPFQQSSQLTQGCPACHIDQRIPNALLQLLSQLRFGRFARGQYPACVFFRDRGSQFREVFERPHLMGPVSARAKSNERFPRSDVMFFQHLQRVGVIFRGCPEFECVREDRKAEIAEQVQISFDLVLRQVVIDGVCEQTVVASIVLSFFGADCLGVAEPVSGATEIGDKGGVIPIGVPPGNDSQIEVASSELVFCKIRCSSVVTKSRPIGR